MVEITPVRCPPLDEGAKAVLGRRVARPKAPVDVPSVRAWIDRHEIEQERKIAAGELLIREYDACRNPETPQS